MNGAVALAAVVVASLPVSRADAWRGLAEHPDFASPTAIVWGDPAPQFWLSTAATTRVEREGLNSAFDVGAALWASAGCGSFAPVPVGFTEAPAMRGDGMNTVQIVREGWSALGLVPDASGAAADVQLEQEPGGDWRVVEVDIYVNAEEVRWAPPVGDGTASLSTALAHELGHAAGLLHPCGDDGVPDCSDAFAGSVMQPETDGMSLRALGEDDLDGICTLYPATTCTTDDECESGTRCRAGHCESYSDEFGEPCLGSSDCASGICIEPGVCTFECDQTSAVCPLGASCRVLGAMSPSVCVRDRSVFAECARGRDCDTGICLTGALETPVCTSRCPVTGCLLSECADVEGRAVCVPHRMPTQSCSVSSGAPQPAPPLALTLVLCALLAWRRRPAVLLGASR